MRSGSRRLLLASLFCLGLATGGAEAQRVGTNVAGDFDYYVLSLSWSPSYCEAEAERADRFQCAGGRPYSFVVHGLWPQYERGWPEFCPAATSRPSEQIVRSMLDIMPSPGLVRYQWQKHGTCAGLSVEGYFDLVRKARDRVVIPPAFRTVNRYVTVEPGAVENAFRRANPGLAADAIAVDCDRSRLREVRICMDKALNFRGCREVDRRACRLNKVVLPPVRGG
ncbi:ribonuclease T2 [Microbaculum marinisediminis]|uniref:Ribonuclease T2 n=1 Tax=Microbaculum marinisediminis TaxID=2931392 RepID=A0AAW5R3K8_9HYPH|nr:ribonuclease T2 [Microbaculum sp. A6E488]MCT8974835.1 ribonuclease T2 [Microbaculum sp. A6E488]